MKWLILLTVLLAFSCQKEVLYPSVNIKAKNNDMLFYYGQENGVSNSCDCNEMDIIIGYDPSSNCYISASSTDSLTLTIVLNRDTIYYEEGYQNITLNQRL